jgi:group I intron endonuclease
MPTTIVCPSGIYAITNTVNGKKYIGSAVNIKIRWTKHRVELKSQSHHSRKLQNSWNKHGAKVFEFSVLEYVFDKSKLLEREQFWFGSFNPCVTGYNILPTAGSHLGAVRSDESKERIRLSNTGRKLSKEQIELLRTRRSGTSHSLETRLKMSNAHKGHSHGLGYKHTPEAIEKIANASRLRKQSPEHIEKRTLAKIATQAKKKAEQIAAGTYAPRVHTQEHIANRVKSRIANKAKSAVTAQ